MSDELICDKIRELLKAEIAVIEKHLDEHKWFQHIEDKNIAVNDFIEKYAWLMREMFCNFSCKKENCQLREVKYKLSDLKDIVDKIDAIIGV